MGLPEGGKEGVILLFRVTRMKNRCQLGHEGQKVFSDVSKMGNMTIHTESSIF